MVRAAMLDHAPVPADHIHPVPTTGLSPEAAASAYDATLRAFKADAPERPLFDLVLLGLGTNGHTASLFPGEPAVDERTAWAAPVAPPGEPIRITLTCPPLEDTRHAAFLVAGADKAEMVARTRAHDPAVVAAHYVPKGDLHWWLDQAAT
jgi:6-phosphogluconolactonase